MRFAMIAATMVNIGITSVAHADFQLEMSGQEIREALGRRAIEDLDVGETAGVQSINTCSNSPSQRNRPALLMAEGLTLTTLRGKTGSWHGRW